MDGKKVVFLNPTSKLMDKGITPLRLPVAFEEKALGIIWNRKPGGDILLERLGKRLNERFHFKRILKINEKFDIHSKLSENSINDLVEECGLAIIGIGD